MGRGLLSAAERLRDSRLGVAVNHGTWPLPISRGALINLGILFFVSIVFLSAYARNRSHGWKVLFRIMAPDHLGVELQYRWVDSPAGLYWILGPFFWLGSVSYLVASIFGAPTWLRLIAGFAGFGIGFLASTSLNAPVLAFLEKRDLGLDQQAPGFQARLDRTTDVVYLAFERAHGDRWCLDQESINQEALEVGDAYLARAQEIEARFLDKTSLTYDAGRRLETAWFAKRHLQSMAQVTHTKIEDFEKVLEVFHRYEWEVLRTARRLQRQPQVASSASAYVHDWIAEFARLGTGAVKDRVVMIGEFTRAEKEACSAIDTSDLLSPTDKEREKAAVRRHVESELRRIDRQSGLE